MVTSPNGFDVRVIVQELNRCPCWMNFRGDESEIRAGITRIYFQLAKYDTETIRAGVRSYLEAHGIPKSEGLLADAKVYAFLRVVFAVPGGFLRDAKVYGNWGNPIRDSEVDLLWPFSEDGRGNLKLTGVNTGEYLGPPYDAGAEFDELLRRYGRRDTEGPKMPGLDR